MEACAARHRGVDGGASRRDALLGGLFLSVVLRLLELRSRVSTMDRLHTFIGREREHYGGDDNNRFAFSLGQASRYYRFLHIVYSRYAEASARFIENSERVIEASQKQGRGPAGPELLKLHIEGRDLTDLLHLEYESFHLFGTIFLDRMACFIERYFGKPRIGRIDTHRKLKNKLAAYAAEKGLMLPEGFADSVASLEDSLAEFRDKEIAHDKSPRSMHLTMWTSDGEARLAKTKLYPREGDKQVEGGEPRELLAVVEKYIEQLVSLIETNRSRSTFGLKI